MDLYLEALKNIAGQLNGIYLELKRSNDRQEYYARHKQEAASLEKQTRAGILRDMGTIK